MSITFTRTWVVDGVYTDPTSIILSDTAGEYGVKRNDTDAVIVAANTAMTKVSTGVYSCTFDEPAAQLNYTAQIKIVYLGKTYVFEVDLVGAATPTVTLPTVIGNYHTSIDIARVYGSKNVLMWADLDNDQSLEKVTNQLQTIIDRTESWFNSRFRRSQYTVPFVAPIPLEVTEICSIQSGAKLYEPRSQDDFTTETGQAIKTMVSMKLRRGDQMMKEILCNKVVLDVDIANRVQTDAPSIVRDKPSCGSSIHFSSDRGEITFSDV
jgi:hypothetical protein